MVEDQQIAKGFEGLHPAVQITVIICVAVVMGVYFLAQFTDFFNKKR